MGREVDVDDLVDSADVAELLGLSERNSVNLYRRRYADFPAPVFERPRSRLWLRSEIIAWARARNRR